MKRKWIVVSIIIVALIAICAGMILVTWMGIRSLPGEGAQTRVFQTDIFSATADEEWTLDTEGSVELLLDSSAGDILITGADTDQVQIIAHKTAWASSNSKAQAALDEMYIDVSQSGEVITIRFEEPPKITLMGSIRSNAVDFTIIVPQQTLIEANTDFGDVDVADIGDSLVVKSDFGDITVTDIEGSVDASSKSGKITAQRIAAEDENIKLESAFGDVGLEDASGGSVLAHSNSGSIELENVAVSGEADLSSEFGEIIFATGSAGNLTADTNSGEVELNSLRINDRIFARSEFGDIILTNVNAEESDLETNSGSVTVEGCAGIIKANTGFGDIELTEAEDVTIDLKTDSGSITFAGTLGDGPHSLNTQFGDIDIAIPADSAVSFDFKTGFGSISSDFPITINGGDIEEKHWIGTIHGGGAELVADTESGSISLEYLDH